MSRAKRWFGVIVLTALFAAITCTFAQQEKVIDGALEPNRIDDTTAWELAFLVVQPSSKDLRWAEERTTTDSPTFMESWLEESGLSKEEGREIVRGGMRYWEPRREIESKILASLDKGRNDKEIDELIKLKKAKLNGIVMGLDLSPASMEAFKQFIKRGTSTTQQSSLNWLVKPLYAQSMSSGVSRYIAVSFPATSRWIAAKGVASTGGSFGHTTKIITKITSPTGRIVTATSAVAFDVTATAYMDLCGVNCEDGVYSTSLVGNIYCRYGGAFPQFATTGPKPEPEKFITLYSVRWTGSNAWNAATITSMPKINGTAWLRGVVKKSTNCGITKVASDGGIAPNTNMQVTMSAKRVDIQLNETTDSGEGFWKVVTGPSNPVIGEIGGSVALVKYPECPSIEWYKSASIKVQ